MKRARTTLAVVYLLLAWMGSSAVLAYEHFSYDYGTPIDHLALVGQMFSVNLIETASFYLANPINKAMLATAVIALGLSASSNGHKNKLLYTVAILTMPLGLLGLMVSVASMGKHDGEWLAEGWPMLEVLFPWCMALLAFAYFQKEATTQVTTSSRPAGKKL